MDPEITLSQYIFTGLPKDNYNIKTTPNSEISILKWIKNFNIPIKFKSIITDNIHSKKFSATIPCQNQLNTSHI